jgi:hypothetical protein
VRSSGISQLLFSSFSVLSFFLTLLFFSAVLSHSHLASPGTLPKAADALLLFAFILPLFCSSSFVLLLFSVTSIFPYLALPLCTLVSLPRSISGRLPRVTIFLLLVALLGPFCALSAVFTSFRFSLLTSPLCSPIQLPLSISGTLPRVAEVLRTSASVRHSELHPIVATLINGMDEITCSKGPRKLARKDPARVSAGLRGVLSRCLTFDCNVRSTFTKTCQLFTSGMCGKLSQLLTCGQFQIHLTRSFESRTLARACDFTVTLRDGYVGSSWNIAKVHRFKVLETVGIA